MKSFGAKTHHFLTISLLSSFLPLSNLLLLFSRSFAAKSHLVPVVSLLSFFLPLGFPSLDVSL
jgi:hypothetical protein